MDTSKPFIHIDLPALEIDFLYHEFDEVDDGLMLKTTTDVGKYINSMITVSAQPAALPITDHNVIIYLPVNYWNHHILSGNFITVISWKKKMIEQYLMSEFKLRVKEFFLVGYGKGHSQDAIIKAFLAFYSIKNNTVNYDSIKKMDYRNRQKTTDEVKRGIQLELKW